MSLPTSASELQVSCAVTKAALDMCAVISEVEEKRREDEELKAEMHEREQKLESLQRRIDELHMDQQKAQQLHSSFDLFLKNADVKKIVEKAERKRKEVLQSDEQIVKLKEEKDEVMERKLMLDHEVQRHTVYQDIMEQMVTMTKFKDAALLTDNLESQLQLREQLEQREREAREHTEQQRKTLAALEDQHDLMQLQTNNQLSQLQTKLEETRSDALIWEKRWSHIQETATKKTLLLGQIKMATLNLYEMTGGTLDGEEGIKMNETEKQLEKIKMFIQDHQDIVRQMSSQTQRGAQKRQRHINLKNIYMPVCT